jgi:hypothetical protein
MKPIEKLAIVGPIMMAWTIVWLLMPRFPEETINAGEWAFFIFTQLVSLFLVVKWWSQYLQEKQSDHIKKAIRKHDQRTNR